MSINPFRPLGRDLDGHPDTELPTHARAASRTGHMASYVQALAAELNATEPEHGDARWMHVSITPPHGQDTWHYLALVEHGTDVEVGRMIVRRQNGNAGRVSITPLLGEGTGGSRGYSLSDEDRSTLKPFTGELTDASTGTAVRAMARRVAQRTDAWMALIGKAAAWQAERMSDAAARDKLAGSIVNLYGGFAHGQGDERATGVTVYPNAPHGSMKHPDCTSVYAVQLEADGQHAEMTLRHVPADVLGKVFALLGY